MNFEKTYWGEASMRARAAGGRQATVGSAFAVANKKKGTGSIPALGTEKSLFSNQAHRGVGCTVQTGSEV